MIPGFVILSNCDEAQENLGCDYQPPPPDFSYCNFSMSRSRSYLKETLFDVGDRVIQTGTLCANTVIHGYPFVIQGSDTLEEREYQWSGSYDPALLPDVVKSISTGSRYKGDTLFGRNRPLLVSNISAKMTVRYLPLNGTAILKGCEAQTIFYDTQSVVVSTACCGSPNIDPAYPVTLRYTPPVSDNYGYGDLSKVGRVWWVEVAGPVHADEDVTGLSIGLDAAGVTNGPWKITLENGTLTLENPTGLTFSYFGNETLTNVRNSINGSPLFNASLGIGVLGSTATISDLKPFSTKFLASTSGKACLLIVEKFDRLSDNGRYIGRGATSGSGIGPVIAPTPATSGSGFTYSAAFQSLSFEELVKGKHYPSSTSVSCNTMGLAFSNMFDQFGDGGYSALWSSSPNDFLSVISTTNEGSYLVTTSSVICQACNSSWTGVPADCDLGGGDGLVCGFQGGGFEGFSGCAYRSWQTETVTSVLQGQAADRCNCYPPVGVDPCDSSMPQECREHNAETTVVVTGCGGTITITGPAYGFYYGASCFGDGTLFFDGACLNPFIGGWLVRCVTTQEEIPWTQPVVDTTQSQSFVEVY